VESYYTEKLSADRLKKCYEIAPPRVKQYLEEELNYVLQKIKPGDNVIELGCGYGRIISQIAEKAKSVIGIDTSLSSIQMGKQMLTGISNCSLMQMDALQLDFPDNTFDLVVCIQNGISAFHVNQIDLVRESIRVTKSGGLALFSSYSGKFWDHRLNWFELQSQAGLLGEIDYEKTGNGVIVCKDGFTAATVGREQFKALTSAINNIDVNIVDIDESSIFCEIKPI
jgi:2-polyprenyl-6-hydroxyphenyl methylase/3-demethylubiquinone-9 3-methyltransferase